MLTKDITVLRNFSHVTGAYIRGEHRRAPVELADQFIAANLVVACEHEHEGDKVTPVGILETSENIVDEVDAIEKPKRTRRKKADK